MARPVILDCDGVTMSAEERSLFKDLEPFGFILFARNCQSPDQLKKLTDEMKEITGRADVPIFIDQEGGRVCRLNTEHWRRPPSGEELANLYRENSETGLDAVKINARLMAEELRDMGITVNCYPVMDLNFIYGDQVIGDRSFGDDVKLVSLLSEAACEGLLSGGVLPVIKHIPGHGRAKSDSHKELPIVDTPFDILAETDFVPFKALNHMPLAMTAHIVYSAIDDVHPATLSETIIRRVIREHIGFKGVLISDDVSMKALEGNSCDNAKAALRAGCDLVLHCNSSLEERREMLETLYDFNVASESWVETMFNMGRKSPEMDRADMVEWLEHVLTN